MRIRAQFRVMRSRYSRKWGALLGNRASCQDYPAVLILDSQLGPLSQGLVHLGETVTSASERMELCHIETPRLSDRALPPDEKQHGGHRPEAQCGSHLRPALTVCGIWTQSFYLSDPPFLICEMRIIIGTFRRLDGSVG